MGYLDVQRVKGDLLVQDADLALLDDMKVVTGRAPTDEEMADPLFGWTLAGFVKSNASGTAKGNMTIAVSAPAR